MMDMMWGNILLAPLAALWYTASVVRGKLFDWHWLPSRSYDMPVICVGNLAAGGTGKTPHVELLLRLLQKEGWRVAMLSRGYGRQTKGYVLANKHHTARDIGDEPYQMLHNCPFATIAVCERRTVGMDHLLALPNPPDVVVLDDAFQHRYVKAGLNILLTDAHRLFTHDHLIPWGRLREPANAARRAQMVIVTKCNAGERPTLPLNGGQKLFYSSIDYGEPYHILDSHATTDHDTAGKPVMLIAGIANPKPLQEHLKRMGASEVHELIFPDHHAFSAKDVLYINKEWQKLPDGALAFTTQKDATRLRAILPLLSPSLANKLLVQPITVVVEAADKKQETFNQSILSYVKQNSRNSNMD